MSIREQVTEFHRTFGQPTGDVPKVPADDRVRLRLRLIAEEFFELLEACLNWPGANGEEFSDAKAKVAMVIDMCEVDVALPEAADALADIAYVVEGSALEFGVNSEAVLAEVHAANMRKVGGGKEAGGKIKKPEGWTAPDVEGVLKAQGWTWARQ